MPNEESICAGSGRRSRYSRPGVRPARTMKVKPDQSGAVAKATRARTTSGGMVCSPLNSRYCTGTRAFLSASASERDSSPGHTRSALPWASSTRISTRLGSLPRSQNAQGERLATAPMRGSSTARSPATPAPCEKPASKTVPGGRSVSTEQLAEPFAHAIAAHRLFALVTAPGVTKDGGERVFEEHDREVGWQPCFAQPSNEPFAPTNASAAPVEEHDDARGRRRIGSVDEGFER